MDKFKLNKYLQEIQNLHILEIIPQKGAGVLKLGMTLSQFRKKIPN